MTHTMMLQMTDVVFHCVCVCIYIVHRPGNLSLAGNQCGGRTNGSSCMEFMHSIDSAPGFPCECG